MKEFAGLNGNLNTSDFVIFTPLNLKFFFHAFHKFEIGLQTDLFLTYKNTVLSFIFAIFDLIFDFFWESSFVLGLHPQEETTPLQVLLPDYQTPLLLFLLRLQA